MLCLAAALVTAPPTSASTTPVDVPAGVEAGALLPIDPVGRTGVTPESASPGYVLAGAPVYDEYAGTYLELRRTSDAAVVRKVYYSDQNVRPLLDGDQLLVYRPATSDAPAQWAAEDVASGAVRWTVTLSAGDSSLWAGADAVLVARHESSAAETYAIDLLTPDGSRIAVVPTQTNYSIRVMSSRPGVVAVALGRSIWRVDTRSGAATQTVAPHDLDYGPYVTETRTFWGWHDFGTGDDHLSWWDVDGAVGATVDVPDVSRNLTYVPFGDRLAAFESYCNGCVDLRPVDLATGGLDPAVAGPVDGVRTTGDGSVTFSQLDGTDWRLATVADDGRAPVMSPALPDPGRPAAAVGLSGGRVAASFGLWGPVVTKVTGPDGSAPWSGELTSGEPLTGNLVAYAGDVAVTETETMYEPPTYHLWWPGGHRDVVSYGLELGHGGQLVRFSLDGSTVVQEARSGRQVDPGTGSDRMVLDGTRVWRTSDNGSQLTVTDTATGRSGAVPTGLNCTAAWLEQVVGRYARVVCGATTLVVDLTGVQSPYTVTTPGAGVTLGAGFVAGVVNSQDAHGQYYSTLDVTELAGEHRTRSYGLMHGGTPPEQYAVDDADAPAAVYIDGTRQLRKVDLSWIESAAPVAAAPPSSPRSVTAVAGDREATVSWVAPVLHPEPITGYVVTASPGGRSVTAAPDASSLRFTGLANNTAYTFTVAAISDHGTSPAVAAPSVVTPVDVVAPVAWISPEPPGESRSSTAVIGFSASDATDDTSSLRYECSVEGGSYHPCSSPVTLSGLSQGGHVFAVRAIDPSGNRSAVAPTRWNVDTIRPRVTMTGPTSVAASSTRFTASFRLDDIGKAGAQARYIAAPYTSGWRSWVYPRSWQSVPYDYVTVSGAPGWTYCVSVRGWDLARNYSAWAPYRCAATPVDDRSLAHSTGWTRYTSRAFSGGSALRSTRRGATLTRRGVQTRRIYLVASRCISCGSVGVYWNGALVRTVSLQSKASGSTRRAVIGVTTFAGVRSGTLTLRVLSSGRPVQIDGVVLPRV